MENLSERANIERSTSASSALKSYRAKAPTIVITELEFPGFEGLAFVTEVRRRLPNVRLVVLTASTNVRLLQAALARPLHGFVQKSESLAVLTKCLEAVIAGQISISAYGAVQLQYASVGFHEGESLSQREQTVLTKIAEGLPSKAIAADLDCSQQTIERVRASLGQKLRAGSIAELARWAVKLDLIDEDPLLPRRREFKNSETNSPTYSC